MKIVIFILVFIFAGCSFKTPIDQTSFKLHSAFKSYQTDFLSGDEVLARYDLKRAILFAKQNANVTQLATIYLGQCALDISVGVENSCKEYKNISDLLDDKKLQNYNHLIKLELKDIEIEKLPPQYQEFAKALIQKEYQKAIKNAMDIKNISSKLIALALIKDKLNKQEIKHILEITSLYGYKKSSIFWLKRLRDITKSKLDKILLTKHLTIIK